MSTRARMQKHMDSLEEARKRATNQAVISPLMENLMRLGYVVRGLIYGVIGVLALRVALGIGGSLNDPQGAIAAMGRTPAGIVILWGILIGLIGYALWGLIRAVFDPLHKGTELKGLIERLGYAVSGISYGLLALATYGLITGRASAAQNGAQTAQAQQTAASILSKPWGPWVIAIAGLIVIGVGLANIVKSVRPDFEQQFQMYALSRHHREWIIQSGRFGTAARGVVFALVGLFLFLAAYRHDPRQAQGFEGVLATMLRQPYGPWALGIVALGLIAFGIYSAMSGFLLRLRR